MNFTFLMCNAQNSSVSWNVRCTGANACVVKELMSNLEQHVIALVHCIF